MAPTSPTSPTQTGDPDSLLSRYRDLIHLRAAHPALAGTETVVLSTVDDPYLAQLRSDGEGIALVVTNFGPKPVTPTLDLSGAPCIQAGMAVEALYGTDSGPRSTIRQRTCRSRSSPRNRPSSSGWTAPRTQRRLLPFGGW